MENGIVKLTPELMALFAGQGNGNALAPFSREVFLLDINVAGTGYCDKIEEIFPLLKDGMVLKMLRDPKNKYDKFAIGIYYGETRIGWVPRALNTVISRLMDAGKAFFCRITSLDGEEENQWKDIKCKIYMVE